MNDIFQQLMFGQKLKYNEEEYVIVQHSVGFSKEYNFHLACKEVSAFPSQVYLIPEAKKVNE